MIENYRNDEHLPTELGGLCKTSYLFSSKESLVSVFA